MKQLLNQIALKIHRIDFSLPRISIPRETRKTIYVSALTFFLLLGITGSLVWAYRGLIFKVFASEYNQSLVEGTKADSQVFTQESLIINAVKEHNPAVVSIIVSKNVPKYETYYLQQQQQNPLNNFFGQNAFPNFLYNIPQQRQNGTEKKEIGGGSGFFVSANGLIVTNRHVVEDKAAEYTVFTNDGVKHEARVIARDSILDIALIKIEPISIEGYPYLELGDSDSLSVGQSVIAIGNALGEFRNTVSVGVVSGLARSIVAGDASGKSESLDQVIQTDAAINPGNSGGPLLNLQGKVIGVNVAVANGSQSIGFALPVNNIRTAIESVKDTGKITYPYLGVRFVMITPELKEKEKLSVDSGALVKKGVSKNNPAIVTGSPAEKAGVLEGDIITEIDATKLTISKPLASIVRQKHVGQLIQLRILREGKELIIPVTLEAMPETK